MSNDTRLAATDVPCAVLSLGAVSAFEARVSDDDAAPLEQAWEQD